jgi:hypothetical protein
MIENKDKIEYIQYEVMRNDWLFFFENKFFLLFSYNDMKSMLIDYEDIFKHYKSIIHH